MLAACDSASTARRNGAPANGLVLRRFEQFQLKSNYAALISQEADA